MPDKEIMIQVRALEEQLGWRALGETMALGVEIDPKLLHDALAQLAGDWRMLADLYDKAKLKGAKTSHIEPLRHAARQLDVVIDQLGKPRRAPLGQLQPPPAEPKHRFMPDEDNSSCAAVVDDTLCTLLPGATVHDFSRADGEGNAGSPAGLDALIADSIAKHRDEPTVPATPEISATRMTVPAEAVLTPEQIAERLERQPAEQAFWAAATARLDSPPDVTGVIVIDYHTPPSGSVNVVDPGAVLALSPMYDAADVSVTPVGPIVQIEPLGDVAAYLRGDIDELPGGEPLRPRTAHDMTETEATPWRAEEGPELVRLPPGSVVHPPGWGDPASDPLADIERTAKEILESHDVTSPSTLPPVPLLGQPGDAGAGYDHTYIPPGGAPATFADLLTPIPAAALPPHLSHSQIEMVGNCATKYRLQRIDGTVQIPQWALIGGNAFHVAVEHIERVADTPETIDPAILWAEAFGIEVHKIEESSPVPRSRWRGSKGGAEGETWWNANGPKMIENYLKARPDQPSLVIGSDGGRPAVEWEVVVGVDTPYGTLPYKAIIDRVTWDPQRNAYVIRDYKTGDRIPHTHEQLGEYANALRLGRYVFPDAKIYGTYFNARKGTWTPEIDLTGPANGYTPEWFVYHVTTGHAQRLALTTGPTPARPSTFCGGCSVRYACPVMGGGAKR